MKHKIKNKPVIYKTLTLTKTEGEDWGLIIRTEENLEHKKVHPIFNYSCYHYDYEGVHGLDRLFRFKLTNKQKNLVERALNNRQIKVLDLLKAEGQSTASGLDKIKVRLR